MAARHGMIKLFLIVLFSVIQQQLVRSDSIGDCRRELADRVARLDTNFQEIMNITFYDRFHRATSLRNFPMAQLVARVGRFELLQYLRERKALLVANDIITKYLAAEASSSDDWPPKTRSFADLVVSRSIQRACESEFGAEPDMLKEIYILLGLYDYEQPVADLAHDCSLRMTDKEKRAVKAKEIVEDALHKFRRDAATPSIKVPNLVDYVDELIVEAESGYDSSHQLVPLEQLTIDIRSATQQSSRLTVQPGPAGRVTMEEVVGYAHAKTTSFIWGILQELHEEQATLADEFQETMQEFFHEPQRVANDPPMLDYALMAVSARAAEAEAIMYAAERAMKSVIIRLITQLVIEKSKQFSDPLIQNSNLLNLIWERSIQCALEYGLDKTFRLRKEIYMISKRFQGHNRVEKLVHVFYENLHARKYRTYVEGDETSSRFLKLYQIDVSFVLTDTQVQSTLRVVEDLINDSVIEYDANLFRDIDSSRVQEAKLRQVLGAEIFHKMMAAKTRYLLDPNEVDALDVQEVVDFEYAQIESHSSNHSSSGGE